MRTPRWTPAAAATAAVLTLSACSAGVAEDSLSADGLPVVPASAGHVHGVAVNPADDKVYLGTHGGTMVVEDDGVSRVGDATIDLMGFAVAGPDHFYASGHPGPNDRQPNPVGLIESKDAGRTWSSLSLGGKSDFHTLTAASGAVYGFDGVMKSTTDGRTWTEGADDVAPASIGVHPETPTTVLATTERGPVRSTDGGKTFTTVDSAPVLVFLAWVAPDALWAVDPAGGVHLSADGGVTWEQRGEVGQAPQAFTASDEQTVVVVLADAVVRSSDGGVTFDKIADRS